MFKNLLTLIALTGSFQLSTAHAFDVYGTSSNYIRVTEDHSHKLVKFDFCQLAPPKKCSAIGHGFYKKTDLARLRQSEKWDVVKAAGADVAILAATVLTGGAAGYAMAGGSSSALSIYGTLAGATYGGGFGTIGLVKIFDAINPYEQYKQLETLNEAVIDDRQVTLDYACEDFAKRLGAVLSNL